MQIKFNNNHINNKNDCLVLFIDNNKTIISNLISEEIKNITIKVIELTESFKGKLHDSILIPTPDSPFKNICLYCIGDITKIDSNISVDIGGNLGQKLKHFNKLTINCLGDNFGISSEELSSNIVLGFELGSWYFNKYITKPKPSQILKTEEITLLVNNIEKAIMLWNINKEIASGINLSRSLVAEPANVLYPETFKNEILKLEEYGVKVSILTKNDMTKLGMNSILSVAQGSAREPYIVVMEYKHKDVSSEAVAFVGKGVTFDTGGISIKPSSGMEDMKTDMAGAASVVGLIRALAGRKAKTNVVGVVGLVENMPSSTATRPGDIVTAMNGKTIEIINTDAEGRLVLADAVYYTAKTFNPKALIDIATLTGAIVIGLGHKRSGLFSNDDTLANQITASGEKTNDLVWRFPCGDEYNDLIESQNADMHNVGKGRAGGSIAGAKFIEQFLTENLKWAHLDIAGTSVNEDVTQPTKLKGQPSGTPVRLMERLIADYFEKK